jgi:hypothetical protein
MSAGKRSLNALFREESVMESSKISVKKSLTIVSAGFALLMSMRPAVAGGPNLIHTEAVGQITITSLTFGGPTGCNTSTGVGCTYYILTGTTSGRNTPLGPFTASLTASVLFSAATPSGAHDANGKPTEFCSPELGTETDTFANGSTLMSDFQGLSCCASETCNVSGLPSVNHDSSVIIEGTGRLTGASGGTSWSDNFATSSGPLLMHAEGVLQLPGNSSED